MEIRHLVTLTAALTLAVGGLVCAPLETMPASAATCGPSLDGDFDPDAPIGLPAASGGGRVDVRKLAQPG